MNFTSFTQLILKSLQEELGEGYTVLSETVNKNNGVTRTGITIKREGQNAFPTIYIDHFYKEDMTKEEILLTADRLFESLADAELEEKVDLSGFAEFDSAREKIAYKVISAEKNRKLLKEIPHKIVHNLAVVYFYTVQEAPFYGNAVVLINNHHMRQWKTNPEELFRIAERNSPRLFPWSIDSMEEVMRGMLAEDLSREGNHEDAGLVKENEQKDWTDELIGQIAAGFTSGRLPMYVLTNRQ